MNDPRAFLESYRYAFERFDLDDVLRHFSYPGLVVVDAGQVRQVPVLRADWRGNVAGLIETYRKIGVKQIRVLSAQCRDLSPLLVLAEVEWSLRREDGSVIYDFHNLYVLGRVGGELKICSAVSPDESLKMRAALPAGL